MILIFFKNKIRRVFIEMSTNKVDSIGNLHSYMQTILTTF